MTMINPNDHPVWDEKTSQAFLEYGQYFIPESEHQISMICTLLQDLKPPWNVIDLCCGDGILSEAILERFPTCCAYGLDGSEIMLCQARQRLHAYTPRFRTRLIDLAERGWRKADFPVHAVVSSLAIHHLNNDQKQVLYDDLLELLEPGGVVVIADIVQPSHAAGIALAAAEYDQAVRQRIQDHHGDPELYERFEREGWNLYRYPDPMDQPSCLFDQLAWLVLAGFTAVDVYWMQAGHAIFGGHKPPTVNDTSSNQII